MAENTMAENTKAWERKKRKKRVEDRNAGVEQ